MTRIDAVRVEIDYNVDFDHDPENTAKFEIPTDHPLVQQLRDYYHEQLLAAARAGPPATFF